MTMSPVSEERGDKSANCTILKCPKVVEPTRTSSLKDSIRPDELEESIHPRRLSRHLNNHGIVTEVNNLATKLLGNSVDASEMSVLLPQRLGGGKSTLLPSVVATNARMSIGNSVESVVNVLTNGRSLLDALGSGEDVGSLVGELVLEVLGAENRDLGEKELALDRLGAGVVENGPDGDLQDEGGGEDEAR